MLKIKELRLSRNLSQNELAKVINCNQTAVGKYERGQLEPNIHILNTLADFFGCSIDCLVGREDELGNVAPAKSNVTEKEARLLKAFSTLSTLEQDKLIADAEFYSLRHLAKMDQ